MTVAASVRLALAFTSLLWLHNAELRSINSVSRTTSMLAAASNSPSPSPAAVPAASAVPIVSRKDCRVLRGWLYYWAVLENALGTGVSCASPPPCSVLPGVAASVFCDASGRIQSMVFIYGTYRWPPAPWPYPGSAGQLPPTPFELVSAAPNATTHVLYTIKDFCGPVPSHFNLRDISNKAITKLPPCSSAGTGYVNKNECDVLQSWTSYWTSNSSLAIRFGACDKQGMLARASEFPGVLGSDSYSQITSMNISNLNVTGPLPSGDTFGHSPVIIYVGPLQQLCGPIPPSINVFRAFDGLPGSGGRVSTLPSCPTAVPQTVTNAVTRKGVAGQISQTGRCGPDFDNAICPFGYCCSRSACVDTVAGCYAPLCDPSYGLCYDRGSTGNEQPTFLSTFAAGDGMEGNRADKFFLVKEAVKQPCTNETLPQLDPQELCVTVTVAVDMPVIQLAAMYGTNPLILERDNPVLAAYSRALNGNSSNGTAVGLLALAKGSVLAVRPAEGIESRRFNPSGGARKGTLDEEAFPRPCWGFSTEKARHDCFCSYHHHGSFVLPGAQCSKVLLCANGKAAGITTCPAGEVADDLDELSGAAECYQLNTIDGEFQCGDGCSSFSCFCAEYLVPSFTPDARYLNPFDDTKATVLICDSNSRGWYGGVEYPSAALRKRFQNNMSKLKFDPITQKFTSSLAPQYTNAITRISNTGCTGVPYVTPADLVPDVTSPAMSPLTSPKSSPTPPPKHSPKQSPKPTASPKASPTPSPKASPKPSPKPSPKNPPRPSPKDPLKSSPGPTPKYSPRGSPRSPSKGPSPRRSPKRSPPRSPKRSPIKTTTIGIEITFPPPKHTTPKRSSPKRVRVIKKLPPRHGRRLASWTPGQQLSEAATKPYWATNVPSRTCAARGCCGDYPDAATEVGIICPASRCVEGRHTTRRQASSWSPQRRRNCGASFFGSCPVMFEKGCSWGNSKNTRAPPKGQRTK